MANDRVSQQPVEVVLSPTDTDARTTQAPVEAVLSPTSGKARTSQQAVEAVIQIIYPSRIAQLPVEVAVSPTDAEARLAQVVAEVAVSPTDVDARLAQFVVEVAVERLLIVEGALDLNGVGTFVQGGTIAAVRDGALDITGAGTLELTSALDVSGALDVTGTGTLEQDGQIQAAFRDGELLVTGQATLVQAASIIQSGALAISGSGDVMLPGEIAATAQHIRPSSDVTNTGTGGWADLDEATASDTDRWYGDNNVAETLEVHLTDPTDPQSSSGHIIRYRVAKTNAGTLDGGGNAVTVTASLYQGGTLIVADSAKTVTGTWTTYELTLSGAQADAITAYSDLRLRFVTSASGGTPANRRGGAVSWAEMELPGVSTISEYGQLDVTGTGTLAQAGELAKPGALSVTGSGTLEQNGTTPVYGELLVSGAGTLDQAPTLDVLGALAVTGTGALAQAGELAIQGALAVTGTGTLSQTAEAGDGAIAVTGTGAVAFGGALLISGALAVTGTGILAQNGTIGVVTHDGALAVTGTGALAQSLLTDGYRDDFDRIVAGNSSGWGEGPLGRWVDGFSGTYSVDGDLATFAGTNTAGLQSIDTTSLIQDGDIEGRVRFQWPSSMSANNDLSLSIFTPGTYDSELGVDIEWVHASTEVRLMPWWINPSFGSTTVVVGTSNPQGQWATLVWGLDRGTNDVRAKYWLDGDPEPAWETTPSTGDWGVLTEYPGIYIWFVNQTGGRTWVFDDVDLTPPPTPYVNGALAVTGTGTLSQAPVRAPGGRLAVTGIGSLSGFARADWVGGWPVTGVGTLGLNGERVLPTSTESYAAEQALLPREIVITIDGVDVTDDIRYSDANFISQVNGTPGTCSFAVKDLAHTHGFTVGNEIDLWVDGILMWSGFVRRNRRQYSADVVDTSDPQATARWFLIEGSDVNVLLSQRIVYYKPNPAQAELRPPASLRDAKRAGMWREDAPVADVVKYVLANFTDLLDDGVDLSGITIAGTMNPDDPVTLTGAVTVADFLRLANRLLGGIFYLTPDRRFIYRDVDTATTNFYLTDDPTDQDAVGPRDYSFVSDAAKMANDALVWGTAPGVATVAFSRVQDTSAQTEHGRWQVGEYNTTMYKQASVDTRANALVYGNLQSRKGANVDRLSCEATIFTPTFFLGDIAWCESKTFTAATQSEPFDDTATVLRALLPVRRIGITFPTKTAIRANLLLTQDLDDPWSIYEFVFPIKTPGTPEPPQLPEVVQPGCDDATCGITDTFTRTVSGAWGTSDAGVTWSTYNDGDVGATYEHSVDGSRGLTSVSAGGGHTYSDIGLLGYQLTSSIVFNFAFTANMTGGVGQSLLTFLQYGGAQPRYFGFAHNSALGAGTYLFLSHKYPNSDVENERMVYSLVSGDWYSLRYEREEGVEQRIRVWPMGDPEPGTWDLTDDLTAVAASAPSGFEVDVSSASANDGTVIFEMDQLNIAGVSRCDGVQFDDFNRTVAANGWGIATNGTAWTSLAGTGAYSVNGSAGVIGALSNGQSRTLGWNNSGVVTDTPWYNGGAKSFTMKVGFRLTSIPTSGYAQLKVEPGGEGPIIRVTTSILGGVYNHLGTQLLVKQDWVANQTYVLIAVYDASTGDFTYTLDGAAAGTDGVSPADTLLVAEGLNSGSSTARTIQFDYIEFDYEGKPCFPCTSEQFDNFNRSVTTGWGNATFGGLWSNYGPGNYTVKKVEDGYGKIEQGPATGGGTTGMQFFDTQVTDGQYYRNETFSLVTRLKVEAASAGSQAQTGFYFEQDFSPFGRTGFGLVKNIGGGAASELSLFHSTTAGSSALSTPVTLSVGSHYLVRYERTGTSHRARVWADGATEPSTWDLDDSGIASTAPNEFRIVHTRESPSGLDWKVWYDYIEFSTDCEGNDPAEVVVPASGPYCETIHHAGGVNMICAAEFVQGSAVVYINGARLIGTEYTQNGNEGLVILDTAVSSSDTVRICYQIGD